MAFGSMEADVSVFICKEQEHLVRITLSRHYPDFEVVRWVSEKLLFFVRVWWGRVVGSDTIFDVEAEPLIYAEALNDGSIPFDQARTSEARDE